MQEHIFATGGPTTSSSALSTLAALNSTSTAGFGFTNWRRPSYDISTQKSPEAESMFATAPATKDAFWSWWRDQGFDEPLPPVGAGSALLGKTGYYGLGTQVDFSFWVDVSNNLLYYYRDVNGHTGILTSYPAMGLGSAYSLLLPVRSLPADEFYFYRRD